MKTKFSPLQEFLATKLLGKKQEHNLKILHQINQVDVEMFFKQLLPTSDYTIETNKDSASPIKLKIILSRYSLCEYYCSLVLQHPDQIKKAIQSLDDDVCREMILYFLQKHMHTVAKIVATHHDLLQSFDDVFQAYQSHDSIAVQRMMFPMIDNIMKLVYTKELDMYTVDYSFITNTLNTAINNANKSKDTKHDNYHAILHSLKKNNIVITEDDVRQIIEIEQEYKDDAAQHHFNEIVQAIFLSSVMAKMNGLKWCEVPHRMSDTHLRINDNLEVLSHQSICLKQYWLFFFLYYVAQEINQLPPSEMVNELKKILMRSYLKYQSTDRSDLPTFESYIKLFHMNKDGSIYSNFYSQMVNPYLSFFLKESPYDNRRHSILLSIKGDVTFANDTCNQE